MNTVQVEQKSYEMPREKGSASRIYFLTVADIRRSGSLLRKGFLAAPHPELRRRQRRTWVPSDRQYVAHPQRRRRSHSPDKPSVTLSVPDPNHINSFLNMRVADIQALPTHCGQVEAAKFITEPIPKYGEIRCYIRDPDGYIIEIGQSTDVKYG